METMLTDNSRVFESEMGTPENELVAAAKRGDLDAFGVLFEMNKNAVYAFVHKSIGHAQDAEDIVQEVFFRAWKSISSLRSETKFLSWLYRIAVNLCADRARRAKSRSSCSVDAIDNCDLESIAEPTLGLEDGSVLRCELVTCLQSLPVSQRILVVLCDIQGFTQREAADIIGCSPANVCLKLCSAHKKLRKLLSREVE
ncbi:RNA polymerase sigma factor [bacterium]|nr:RNA polymerase sigma factor [bacterium]